MNSDYFYAEILASIDWKGAFQILQILCNWPQCKELTLGFYMDQDPTFEISLLMLTWSLILDKAHSNQMKMSIIFCFHLPERKIK